MRVSKSKVVSLPWALYFSVAGLGVALISMVAFSFLSGREIAARYAPLVDAAMEIKLEATLAHLWFEELISGDAHESIDEVWTHIEQSMWYTRAMLQGGSNEEGTFPAVNDPKLVAILLQVLEKQKHFYGMAKERWENRQSIDVGIDSPMDQRFDALFGEFLQLADDVETLLQRSLQRELLAFERLQYVLFGAILLLSLVVAVILHGYLRRREADLAALKDQEERIRVTLNSIGDAVIATDTRGRVQRMNRVAEELTGWAWEDALEQDLSTVFVIINTDTREAVENPVARVMESGKVVGLANHTTLVSKDGFERQIADSGAPIRDMDGYVSGVVLVFRDVSEEYASRQRLRESESRFRALFEHAPLPFQSLDARGNFLDVNSTWLEILGYDKDEVLGRWFGDFISLEYKTIFDGDASLFGEGCLMDGVEFKMLKKRGGVILARFNSRVQLDERGRFLCAHCMFTDITERRKFEDALRESEQRFRNILDKVELVAVQGYDSMRRLFYWNNASERLYGYNKQEAVGRCLDELIFPESERGEFLHALNEWLTSGTPPMAREMLLRHKNGQDVPVYMFFVAQENISGTKEMYCIDVDISVIKKAQAALIEAKEQAEAANKAKATFLANMSHELRTPLNAIVGMQQLLTTTSLSREQQEFVDHALGSARRLTGLVSDILDFSRAEAGKMKVEGVAFDLRNVLQGIEQLHRPSCEAKGLSLEWHVAGKIPKVLRGDQGKLVQVLDTLVGSAVGFTEAGSVEVWSYPLFESQSRVSLLFEVSDSGVGLKNESFDPLFEAFGQGDEFVTRAGLGLSLVKRLVEMQGGEIAASSVPDQGSRFLFCLPFAKDRELPQDDLVEVGSTAADVFAIRVLVADEDEFSRRNITKLLKKFGCSVAAVADGGEVLLQLGEKHYDVLLMDVQMLLGDGVAVSTAIRGGKAGAGNVDIPIVALSAFAMAGDEEQLQAMGVDGYLASPLAIRVLREVITAACGKAA